MVNESSVFELLKFYCNIWIRLTLPNSDPHEISIWLGIVGDILHNDVMSTGRPGLFGSTPGLVVGMGFWNKWYDQIQSNLVISNSLISNYRLSQSENLVPVLTWNYENR